jgi:osmoprotectant transport system permease protein
MSAFSDVYNWLSTGSHWTGGAGVVHQLGVHVEFSAVSVAIACAVALPLGLWLGHVGRGGTFAINTSNVGRAIPTFAVLVLLALGPLGIRHTSRAIVVSLILFAIPPLLTNTYVGVREIDADVREAARGMGMTELELLRRVELPLALPLIMAGIRISVVQVVATTTIAALVGGGGLGRFVVDGLAQHDRGQELSGAVLVAVLALVTERSLTFAQRLAERRRGRRRSRWRVSAADAV